MKKIYKTLLTFTAFYFVASATLNAQSIVATIATQPCNANGQINVTTTGLTPPISYVYSNWMANITITHSNINSLSDNVTGLSAYQDLWSSSNYWSISATDGVNTVNTNITLSPPFQDSIKVIAGVCPALNTLQAVNFTGGTAPFSVTWTNINTNQVYNSNPAMVPSGTFTVSITDAAGCVVRSAPNFSSNIFAQSQSNIQVNITGTSANCTNGTANASASGGTAPYSYLWNNNASSQSISGLTQGSYNCIVTDAIGCQSTGYYYVSQGVTLTYNSNITNATCLQTNGSILSFVSGGTAPYTFLWNNAATTQNITGLQGGQSYNVQITDANGCTGFGYNYVGVTTPISVTYNTSASSCTTPNGSAILAASGGASPYTYLWTIFPNNVSGTTLTNKPSGTYGFKVTDANGCVQSGSVFIPTTSTITAVINNNAVVCPATSGNLNVSVSGSNPPFTYLWNNSVTSANLTGVPLGSYNCVITDAAGCSVTKYGSLSQINPINVGFNSTPASCLYSNNGAVTANATGGTSPYTYSWNNSQTGPTATGLTSGNYFVFVTDANGCHNSYNNSMVYVGYNPSNNACYCTITGTVFADANGNCVQNSGEVGLPNVQIHCSGLGYTYTNANGVYSFLAPSGTYTISQTIQQIYPLASCQSNNQVVTVTAAANCVSTVNFANVIFPLHDLHVITSSINQPIPGNTYSQKVIIQNDGSVTESGVKFGYAHDGQLTYGSCAPWALTQQNVVSYPNWYSITSGFPSLSPGANSVSFINYNVPTNIPLNTVVNFNDSVASAAPITTNWLTDNTPWNNVNYHQATVIGSFDPNFKEVSPKGVGPQGNIYKNDSILTYVVHFQNTGSYYAQNIVVIDSIDSHLNITSLRPGYSDHNYTATLSETGVAKFSFKNINLAWQSGYGDALSSGMFTYSVKLKKNLPVGTQIKNKAFIYFDFNEPIITNTTLNTLATNSSVGIEQVTASNESMLTLFPNPGNGDFTLFFNSKEGGNGSVCLMDISGRVIFTNTIGIKTGENTMTYSNNALQSGIYLVQLKTSSETITKKLIVSK